MHNFFINENQIKKVTNQQSSIVHITGTDVNHIKNVLRLKAGNKICVHVKEANDKYVCEITKVFDEEIICIICEKILDIMESKVHINIVQALPKSDKMELIIQKCTELGVAEFTPLALNRCVVKLDGKDAFKKIVRWQNIAEVAAKQCGRDVVPIVNQVQTIKELPNVLCDYDIILVAYENEEAKMLKQVIHKDLHKIAVIIGPEGGIESSEIETFRNYGYEIISLGKRILRTETVGIALSSVIMYETGELG